MNREEAWIYFWEKHFLSYGQWKTASETADELTEDYMKQKNYRSPVRELSSPFDV